MVIASRLRAQRLKERLDEGKSLAHVIKGVESLKERMEVLKFKARLTFLLYTVVTSHSFRSSDPHNTTHVPVLHDFLSLLNETQRKECPLATDMVVSRRSVKRWLSALRRVIDLRTRTRMSGPSMGAIALTADSYRNVAGRDILGITAHALDADFKAVSAVIGVREIAFKQTSAALSASIQEDLVSIFGEGNVPYVPSVVTDNARNYLGAGKILSSMSIGCFAHLLQLVVKDVLKFKPNKNAHGRGDSSEPNSSRLKDLLKKVAKFTMRFKKKKSTYRILHAIRKERGKKPLQPVARVVTRWNSEYLMVKRYLELESDYRKVSSVLKIGKVLGQPEPPDSRRLKEYVDLMEPIFILTTQLSAEKNPILCSVPSRIHELASAIASKPKSETKVVLEDSIRCRLLVVIDKPSLHMMAATLSPRYFDIAQLGISTGIIEQVKDDIAEMSLKLLSKAGKKVPVGWKRIVLSSLDALKECFEEMRGTRFPDDLPREVDFWREQTTDSELSTVTSALFPVARALLAIPASFTPVERVFSVFTRTHTTKRMCRGHCGIQL